MAECGAQARKPRPGGFGRLAWYILQEEAGVRACTLITNRKAAAKKLKHQRTNLALQKKIKTMKNRSPTPPLHVHVDESTPVHVYVKKSHKSSPPKVQCRSSKSKLKGETGSLRRSVKVKTKAPWVPPGKTSQPQKDYKWEGATHRLEITPPEPDKMFSTLRLVDLSTDEEEQVRIKMNEYDKKIESLMTEMGTLKTEVELQRRGQSQVRLSKSKELLEAHKEDLDEMSHDLCQAETANTCLRRSIDRIKEEKCLSLMEKQHLQQEREELLNKLVEAEMGGNAAAAHASLLQDSICKLRNETHMTCSSIGQVTRQKEQLLEKLCTFEETNRSLRQLLRDQQCREEEIQRLLEQKDVLLKRLSDSDTEKARLQLKLCERENEMEDLCSQLQSEKDLTRTASDVSKSLECTKAHLQGQLKNREADNNRLSAQIRNLECSETQQKAELCKLMSELQELKQRADKEKDALKKATRLQKQRAERCEGTVEELTCQLKGKDTQLDEALCAIETWRSRVNKLLSEKSHLEEEITCLSTRVQELIDERQCIEENARVERESLLDKLHRQTQDNAHIKRENERLKATTCAVEEKLDLAYGEVQQLKASLRQYESLVETYKGQVQKTRLEADEICLKLELCDKENKLQKEDMSREVEAVRRKFNGRLAELEQLPEMLKNTESKLQECQEQLVGYEKKNRELSSVISELRSRMEEQGDKMESTRERFQSALEENKQLILKLEEMERKLEEAGNQNRDLVQIVAKREESIHQNQVRLEDKTRECASLARQLEAAIQDARRQVDQTRERASSKERTTTTKVLDLETQLSRTKTELNQLRRSKEDAERRFQSRLQDLKDRLEQSESTNRSMQNYVQFLKSSYANVFGDTTLSSSPVRPRTPL